MLEDLSMSVPGGASGDTTINITNNYNPVMPAFDGEDADEALPIPGPRGTDGSAGAPGTAGAAGRDGATFFPDDPEDPEMPTLVPGPAGAAGAAGAPGSNGAQGPAGAVILPDTPDDPDEPMIIQGPRGATGPAGGGGGTVTEIEQNLGSTPAWRGTFTITDAAITGTSKLQVWQAPGPYTGKGTRADECEMDWIQCHAIPASGTASVRWRSVEGYSGNEGDGSPRRAHVIGRVRGNVKFYYTVAS